MARTTVDREAYEFFREHAGGIVGENARVALELARAEELLAQACALDVAAVEWVDDEEPYDCGAPDEDVSGNFESGAWTGPFGCIVQVFDGTTTRSGFEVEPDAAGVASLWGIVVGPRGTGDPYCRVVAAELASELADDLRQAIGDAPDAREGVHCV